MISVDEALKLIEIYRPDLGVIELSLLEANGFTLASDVLADFTQPLAPTSIMDGYALRKNDLHHELTVVGESRAGQPFNGGIGEKEAVRIFTGAILPLGADRVEIQENATHNGDKLSFSNVSKDRDYIRPAGSDFLKGDLLFASGTRITPAVISALASANIASVTVKRKPSIALLRGGDELRPVGSPLEAGQIVDSNGPLLLTLLSVWGFEAFDLGLVSDDPGAIKDKMSNCEADVILTVGGASVGDYDFMKTAFSELGFNPVFNKVALKPGKPVWLSHRLGLGEKERQVVLGLPGNPHSVWVCAHLLLAHLLGRNLNLKTYRLKTGVPPNGIRERFIRGTLDAKAHVSSLETGIWPLLSMAKTDVLIRRAPLADNLQAGSSVECLHII